MARKGAGTREEGGAGCVDRYGVLGKGMWGARSTAGYLGRRQSRVGALAELPVDEEWGFSGRC